MVLTFFFAQFFGILMLVLGISLFMHHRMYVGMLTEYAERRSALYPLSFLGLVIGSVLVLTHNVWQGGLLPVLVTLLGWMVILKSIAFLVLPDALIRKIAGPFAKPRLYRIIAIMMIVLGAYLLLAGAGGR